MYISNVIKFLKSFQKNNENRYRDYYELETIFTYEFLVKHNILTRNKNILEIGCGGGIFYEEYKDYLVAQNNIYTCIDIDKTSIAISQKNCDYVKFICVDINELSISELAKFDILLMVQVYICIPNMKKIIKKYLKSNPNGRIIIINTIVPKYLTGISNFGRTIINNLFDVNWGEALTLDKIHDFAEYIKKPISYEIIGTSPLSGHYEYLITL